MAVLYIEYEDYAGVRVGEWPMPDSGTVDDCIPYILICHPTIDSRPGNELRGVLQNQGSSNQDESTVWAGNLPSPSGWQRGFHLRYMNEHRSSATSNDGSGSIFNLAVGGSTRREGLKTNHSIYKVKNTIHVNDYCTWLVIRVRTDRLPSLDVPSSLKAHGRLRAMLCASFPNTTQALGLPASLFRLHRKV